MTDRKLVTDTVVAKGIKPCEACGAEKWMLPHVDGQPAQALEVSMIQGGELGSIIGFFPMICTNCSNTRLLHAETLLRDVAE